MPPGCGHPTDFGGERAICGTFLGLGELVPILCPACQAHGRYRPLDLDQLPPLTPAETADAAGAGSWEAIALCEGCRLVPSVRDRPPFLCTTCQAEYIRDRYDAGLERGEPGSRCNAKCGYCGRCGGA